MLRLTLDHVPFGNVPRAETIGVVEIVNDGSGGSDHGHYDVRWKLSGATLARARVEGFPRRALGAWHLLVRAMGALFGENADCRDYIVPDSLLFEEPLYRKTGQGEYELVLSGWGFPADGVWLVEATPYGRSQRCIRLTKQGALPDPLPLAAAQRHHDAACRAVVALIEGKRRETYQGPRAREGEMISFLNPSPVDIVDAVLNAIGEGEADR